MFAAIKALKVATTPRIPLIVHDDDGNEIHNDMTAPHNKIAGASFIDAVQYARYAPPDVMLDANVYALLITRSLQLKSRLL